MSRPLALVLFLACLALAPLPAQRAAYVWLEGEQPDAVNVKPVIAGWGHPEFLSAEKWLQISIEADKVPSEVPPEGVLLRYAFTLPHRAAYEVWNRIGYEFARSPFSWRLDGGEWQTVSPNELTTDLMELQTWNEVAWLKLGDATLDGGAHTLEIRLDRTKDDKGQDARILYASDVICIHEGPFRPHSKDRPGEEGRSAQDEEAARVVFRLPEPPEPGARASVPLKGLWEVCRHDEQIPGETAVPIASLPENPHWSAMPVPGDKNALRPDLLLAHRLWYRTRVYVPASQIGRSFFITFPQNNLNTTVYVNGVLCGFNKNPYARFSIDVTRAVRAGVNEVWVGIRDAWYAYSTNPNDPMKLRRKFNLPLEWLRHGFQDLAYPVWGAPQSGILATPVFTAAGGPAYAFDVFVKPSVARKELAAEITLANPLPTPASGELQWAAVRERTGAVERRFDPVPFSVEGGAERTLNLTASWPNPALWWPDDPQMYRLRVTLQMAGRTVDVSETPFGFREWSSRGKDFLLNGIVWHGWADLPSGRSPAEWLANYRRTNQRMMRFWGTSWQNMTPDEALDFFDGNGVVVRRSGMLDGQAIGYMAIETDPDLRRESEIKMDLMRNWKDQMVAQIRGERNHPSIMIWSIENEWLYINCINLYGGLMDQFEREVAVVSNAVRAVDPTRLTMTDGGGAGKDQVLPVHGDHYVFTPTDMRYPGLAYQANPTGGGRGRWTWDQKRPRFIGEDYYANGINPFDYAPFGGEAAFQGKAQARPAAGLIARVLTEGYRWAEYGAWHFWMGPESAVNQYGSNAPLAVFCRQWDWSFGSGQRVGRTFGIFNDTRFDDPITFTWTLTLAGRRVASDSRVYRVPPGTNLKFPATIALPRVARRQEGSLALSLMVKGKQAFRDVKAVSVLRPTPWGAALAPGALLVHDPHGTVAGFLKSQGLRFTLVRDLQAVPASGKVLIVGRNALSAAQATSSHLAAYAAPGRTVIVLEQREPLRYQGLPSVGMEPASNEGRTAFGEDMGHPALRGLRQKDFFTWGPDEVVYRNAYVKPTRGARSLVQCHVRLQNSALVEAPAGKGLLLLCQLAVGEKLASNAVAQQLLLNLVAYGASYRLERRPVVAAVRDNPLLDRTLSAIGVQCARVGDPLQALAARGAKIAVIAATPANLHLLASNLPKVEQFTRSGGWILLNGLTPEGLASYNKIVGVDHMIRPFRRERVTFPPQRHRLTAGLTLTDIVMLSSERIFTWTSDMFVASDVFSYVVDYEDVAPFARFENDFFLNMVNGFVSDDAWKYIVNVPAPDRPPLDFRLSLPKRQEIVELEWIGNTYYYPVTKVQLLFDGKPGPTFVTKPNNEPQVFRVQPPRSGKELTLRLADWQKIPGRNAVTGLDNIRLKARRPPEFCRRVKPMLNIGAMMEYPKGAGGIVLCNLLFKEREDVPENATKKCAILAALLRNLKAPFAGDRAVIAGAGLSYTPISIASHANQYRDEKGWFGERDFTFKDLPTGTHRLAGVPFTIYDFPTSPVPTVVMLGGPGVPNNLPTEVRGIPVRRKADALFFLHTARLDARRNEREARERKQYEMARYIVTYADGQTAAIPIVAEVDIEDYRQRTPAGLPGAQLAWSRRYPGSDLHAAAWVKQWTNPRPHVEIRSVDLVYGADRRGVPALLAITAATMTK